MTRHLTSGTVVGSACVALLALTAIVVPDPWLTPLIFVGMTALVGIGLVLLTGIAGLTSFGQAAFCGVGAYATAVVTARFGLPPLLGLGAGLLATAAVAVLLGAITARLSSHYLVLGTLAWCISLYYVFANATGLGGFNGLTGLPNISVGQFAVDTPSRFYALVWAIVLAALWASRNLLDSRMGRAIRSLPDEIMAASVGVDIERLKVVVFTAAALLASVSGWLQAHYLKVVTPGSFGIDASLDYLFSAVIGGVGHLAGAVVGAGIVEVTRDLLRDRLPALIGQAGNYELGIFGFIVIVLLQWAPGGVAMVTDRLARSPRHHSLAKPASLSRHRIGRPARLEAYGLGRRFGGLIAVDDVSLYVDPGEILGLIGPNGAGKSTLFNLLSGVTKPDRGTMSMGTARLDGLPQPHICAAGIARTFQHVQLRPAMTVLENVALGAHLRGRAGMLRSALRLDRAEEATLLTEAQHQLDRTGMGELAMRAAGTLSLGQQRIVEIARAMASQPAVLLLDEPAAGLRYAEKVRLAALLRSLRDEGMAILLVEHDMGFVMNLVDRLLVLETGRLIAQGIPSVVRADPGVIEAYLGATPAPLEEPSAKLETPL